MSITALPFADDIRYQPPHWKDAPLSTGELRRLRLLITASSLAAVWYLGWLLQPELIGQPVLFGTLIVAEIFNLAQALGFWWTVAGRRTVPKLPEGDVPEGSVDVFIPTYSEPLNIVEPTVAAAMRISGSDVRVWLLDDGVRPEMEEMAKRHGAGYLTRPRHTGAKAGNINSALNHTDGDFVVILDCDHVPYPELLERTMPAFADERMSFVQTPQYYANADRNTLAAAAWSQQAIFFGPIARGKGRQGSMFCCGTNVVFRRKALDEVGGFPENSLTEDFELSRHLHRAGWRSHYEPHVVAAGLGPEDMASYVSQQHRWARGCSSAMPGILASRLSLPMKISYALSSLYFFSGFTIALYMSLPVLRIFTGMQPLASVQADVFLLHFAPYFALSLMTVNMASRRSFTFAAFALASASFWIHIHAVMRTVFRRPGTFVVTPKTGQSGRQFRPVIVPLTVCAILISSIIYGVVNDPSPGTLNNVAFAVLHLCVLATGIAPALTAHRAARGSSEEGVVTPATVAA